MLTRSRARGPRRVADSAGSWQVEVLEAGHPRLLLNCCRQAGKSTTVALLGLVEAVFVPFTKVRYAFTARTCRSGPVGVVQGHAERAANPR